MKYNTMVRLIPVTFGMLFLSAGTFGCADTRGVCAEDDPGCQLSEQGSNESLASADQKWMDGMGGGLRPDLWGTRFRGSMGRAWVIGHQGYRHMIPDRDTYGNLFGLDDWDDLDDIDDLDDVDGIDGIDGSQSFGGYGGYDGYDGIPVGTPFARGAYFAGAGRGCGCPMIAVVDSCDWCGHVQLVNVCDPCDEGVDFWDSWGGDISLFNGGHRYDVEQDIFNGYGFNRGDVRRYGENGYGQSDYGQGAFDGYPGAQWQW